MKPPCANAKFHQIRVLGYPHSDPEYPVPRWITLSLLITIAWLVLFTPVLLFPLSQSTCCRSSGMPYKSRDMGYNTGSIQQCSNKYLHWFQQSSVSLVFTVFYKWVKCSYILTELKISVI